MKRLAGVPQRTAAAESFSGGDCARLERQRSDDAFGQQVLPKSNLAFRVVRRPQKNLAAICFWANPVV
ncbi:MAG: hypothetical protein IMZ44_05740 [Planctomycetes bacterium]|nr:hypothetical protein [Planctomycetota bacterium]